MTPILFIDGGIEHDADFRERLRAVFSSQDLVLEQAVNRAEGVRRASSGKYALVILDLPPGRAGRSETLRRIRAQSQIPVLIMTTPGERTTRVIGGMARADATLRKPCSPRRLATRVRALIRMHMQKQSERLPADDSNERQVLVVGDVELHPAERRILQAGRDIPLMDVEFDLLRLLLAFAGETLSRDVLSRSILGRNASSHDRSIDVHIAGLRRKLGHRQGTLERIQTVRGIGYRYVGSRQ